MFILKRIVLVALVVLCSPGILSAGEYSIRRFKLDKPGGIYKTGENATVSGVVVKKGKPVTTGATLRCNIKWEGKVVETRDIPCDGRAFKVSYTGSKPGWVYFEFRLLDAKGKEIKNPAVKVYQRVKARYLLAEIGAMFEPEKIRSTVPEPEDFDAFWKKQLAELAKVPMAPVMKESDSGSPEVRLYTVELQCTGGRPATMYLAVPAKAKAGSHGAIVDYLSWSWCDANKKIAVRQAEKGIIAVSATWHGLPVGREESFYKQEGRIFEHTGLRHKGLETPEKWFFTGMYMRVIRALDLIKSRPEWNGKDLVVQGGSLGGAEAAFAAAFDPAVTMAVISVPGFCEFRGSADGRQRSIPFKGKRKFTDLQLRGASYGDTANLCRRIKCETIFCTGFADETCPPSNVFAAYNNLPAATVKSISTNPYTGHYGSTKNVKGNARLERFFQEVTVRDYPGHSTK